MKRILVITATLVFCACIAVVPCFAIQSGWYNGQTMIHLLGGNYRYEVYGTGDDGIILFDTCDMYWYNNHDADAFDSNSTAMTEPDVYINNSIHTDIDASVVYNDLTLFTDHYSLSVDVGVASAKVYLTSDYFELYKGARLGLHLNPVIDALSNVEYVPVGDTVSGTIRFYALNTDGHVIEAFKYRDDLIVGGTYDLTALISEFFQGVDVQYYWIEYEGWNVTPSFVQDFEIVGNEPFTQVRVIDWATDITYSEVISYEDFNLLSWLGTSIDGFLTTTIFSVGGIDVTLGVIVSVPLTIMILIVFLKKFAGG